MGTLLHRYPQYRRHWIGTTRQMISMQCSMAVMTLIVYFLKCILRARVWNCLQKKCSVSKKEMILAGLIVIMILHKKKVQSPEYGGDGKKTTGCDAKQKPDLCISCTLGSKWIIVLYRDSSLKNIRMVLLLLFMVHGTVHRRTQAGYNVVFLPFKDGMPSGEYEVFADGFAGSEENTRLMQHIVLADWHRVLMVHCIYLMIRMAVSGRVTYTKK